MREFNVVVVGCGAAGSAALYALARRGLRVLCLERFEPGHDKGSSHGISRIIRFGYYEHPSYVPLVHRAEALWRDLEQASQRTLLHRTGIIEIGASDSGLVTGTLASSRLHGLPHAHLDAREVMRRFPAFRIPDDYIGVWQPDAGWLEVEPAIEISVSLAKNVGAELMSGVTVRALEPHAAGVRVITDGATIQAQTVVIAAGPWLNSLIPGLPLRVTRQVVAWFEPKEPKLFAPGAFPLFMLETTRGIYYGFPLHAAGLKFAKHFHRDEAVEPDHVDRTIGAEDEALIRDALAEHLPAANGPLRSATICLYTMTPDGHFILDRLPSQPNIIVASPCSGHGFKFAPVIGEAIADLVTGTPPAGDLSRFSIARFA